MSPALFVLGLSVLLAPPLEISATPSTRLYIRTVPPGAKVTVDGRSVGTSDGLFLMPPGVSKVTVELDGHQGETRQVEITEGRITRVEIELKKRPAAPGKAAVPGKIIPPGPVSGAIEAEKIVTKDSQGNTVTIESSSGARVKMSTSPGKVEDGNSDEVFIRKLAAVLPQGWSYRRGATVVVRRNEEPIFVNVINGPGPRRGESWDAYRRRHIVDIEYRIVLHLHDKSSDVPEWIAENRKIQDEIDRLEATPEFEAMKMKNHLMPRTPADKALVRKYEKLNQSLQLIPDGYYGDTDVHIEVTKRGYAQFLDKNVEAECKMVEKRIRDLLTPYKTDKGEKPVSRPLELAPHYSSAEPAKGPVTWTKILATYPAATTTTMDETVAAPLERALIGLPEIGTVVCSSAAGQTEVFVEGKPGIPQQALQAAVHKALTKAQAQLPTQAKVATVGFYEGQPPPPRVDVIVDPTVIINQAAMAAMGVAPDDVQKAIRKAKESGQKLTEVVVENQRGLKVRLTNIAHIMAPQEPAYRVRRWPPEKAGDRVEDVATKFFAALRDKDLQRMKDLSLGSVEGWAVGPPSRRSFPGLHEQLLQVLIKEAPKELDLASLNEVKGTATCGPFAAVRFAGPAHMPKDRYLMAVFKNTPQGWRFVSLQDEIGPLEGALVNRLARWEKKSAEAVATEFLTALRDKDLPTMKSLSLGAVQGWFSAEQAARLPRRLGKLPGLSLPRVEKMANELRDEVYARRPELLARIEEVAVQDDFAAVRVPGPSSSEKSQQYLIVLFKKTSQGWRFLVADDARGPLSEALSRYLKILLPVLAEAEEIGSSTWVFGPVMERTVQDERTKKDWMLDLETGTLAAPPADLDASRQPDEMQQWARQKGMDISGVKAGQGVLHGVDLQIVVLDDTSWDQVTAELLKTALKGHESGGITPQPQKNVQKALEPGGGDRNRVSTIRQPRMTIGGGSEPPSALYGFKTREGGMGVLQILLRVSPTYSVKIRYRLLVRGSEEKPAPITEAAVKTAEGWFRALTETRLDDVTALSDVPFSWDRKELIKTMPELKSRYEQVFAKKGARDLKPSQVSLLAPSEAKEHLKTVWPGDAADTNILVVQITLGTEHVDVLVRPGKEFKVVGFSD